MRTMNPSDVIARAHVPGRPSLAALGILAAILLTAPWAGVAQASAQVSEAWLHATPIEALSGWRSARLVAMGDLHVAVEDPFQQLNAYDFSDNPAGLLDARDSSWVEQGSAYDGFHDRYYGVSHSAISRRGGVRGAVRSEGYVLGLDFLYGSMSASRHDLIRTPDNGRFIRDFDIPLVSSSQPLAGDRTVGASVASPAIALTYARRFRPWLTLGARFGYREESEDRRIDDPYDLDAESRATEYTGGAVVRLPRIGHAVQLAGFGSYIQSRVDARSESPLNDDRFEWSRPQVGYGAELIVRTGWLRGIVDGRHRSYDGEQIARVNWAPQFFLNPFPSETDPAFVFKRRWSSFLSGLRHNEASTRWMVDLPWLPAHVGWEWGYYRQYQWIRPNPTVLQLALPLDVRRLGYRGGAGLSFELPDADGAVAAEVRMQRDFRDDLLGVVPDIATSTLSYHFGGEYRVLRWLPVRAGVALLRHDPDRRDGIPPLKGIRGSVGAGTYWRALGAQIDAAYAHEHFHHAPLDPSLEIGYGDQAVLTITHLF